MANNSKAYRINIPMTLAIVLFCLTLISFHFTGGLYAKYVANDSGADSARVIRFGDLTLTETGDFFDEGKLMIVPGVDLSKKAVVNFDGSESSVYVFVEVILSNDWQTVDDRTFSVNSDGTALMRWSVDSGWNFLKNDGSKYVFYRHLAPNTELADVDIIASDGKITVSDQITNKIIGSMTGISIDLRVTVVQSVGFENPEAAWNSVAAKEGI
ncbi:MAG: hypothetical protein IJD17_04700 [Clostridia bacterium]|nr:hypothetical protein [Clostridia bacterium]